MVWNTWAEQQFVRIVAGPGPRLVCETCQQVVDLASEHDWDLCLMVYKETLKFRQSKGEVIYVD